MNEKILSVALAALMLLIVALPASAAIQATSVEIRGTVANQTAIAGGFNLSNAGTGAIDAPVWTPQSFAGFYYDLKDNLGKESLQILEVSGRTIAQDKLVYTTEGQGKTLKVVANTGNKTYTDASARGLEKFDAGGVAGNGQYTIVGWQAGKYVGVKNKANKLAKLLVEQGTASSDKKTLTIGETWDIGGGWTITANAIDAKAAPRQAWFTLSKDGVKKDDKVVEQGKIYTYVEKSMGGESDVPLLVTYVDSVFAGATSDMVQLRYTWAIDTAITEIKGGDKFGVFEVNSTDPIISLKNTDNSITLSKDSTVDLMGNLKIRVADNDVVRVYPKVDYEIAAAGATPTGTATGATPGVTAKVNVTTAAPTAAATTVAPAATTVAPAATTAKPKATATAKEPGFEAMFAIAGLLAVAYLVLRQRK